MSSTTSSVQYPNHTNLKKNLFLIGFRGTGKTTISRLLAQELGWKAVDADVILEQKAGRTIKQIFDQEGENYFRDLESAILEELSGQKNLVVATGGGVILREKNRTLICQSGTIIWLIASPSVIAERIHGDPSSRERRPNLTVGGLEEIQDLLKFREPLYSSCCDFSIPTDDLSPQQIAGKILNWLDKSP